ncbi:MAG TPA: ATP-grasp domain-containing protein [Fimbriimonas sp.]
MRRDTYDIGFLGGGQLARMSIQAAQRMGLRCLSLDPGEDTPASHIADAVVGRLDDPEKIAQIFESCERATLENEFIPAESIRQALRSSGRSPEALVPGVETLATIQDKLRQRSALKNAGVPSPRAVPIDGGLPDLPFPMVLKARFGGYDGKGTRYARNEEEFGTHRPLWEKGGWMAEEFVPFRRELAVMVALSATESAVYPTMETVQTNHVCDLVFPCDADGSAVALDAVRAVGGIGLFGVELFETRKGEILVNEIAPRPHNTGHYTLDWGATSQFEQHVRLTLDLPLGEIAGQAVCMANLLGREGTFDLRAAIRRAVSDPGVHVHWYGKAEQKPGRKMGHLNVAGGPDLVSRAVAARERFFGPSGV